jgi:hypothetical protein
MSVSTGFLDTNGIDICNNFIFNGTASGTNTKYLTNMSGNPDIITKFTKINNNNGKTYIPKTNFLTNNNDLNILLEPNPKYIYLGGYITINALAGSNPLLGVDYSYNVISYSLITNKYFICLTINSSDVQSVTFNYNINNVNFLCVGNGGSGQIQNIFNNGTGYGGSGGGFITGTFNATINLNLITTISTTSGSIIMKDTYNSVQANNGYNGSNDAGYTVNGGSCVKIGTFFTISNNIQGSSGGYYNNVGTYIINTTTTATIVINDATYNFSGGGGAMDKNGGLGGGNGGKSYYSNNQNNYNILNGPSINNYATTNLNNNTSGGGGCGSNFVNSIYGTSGNSGLIAFWFYI